MGWACFGSSSMSYFPLISVFLREEEREILALTHACLWHQSEDGKKPVKEKVLLPLIKRSGHLLKCYFSYSPAAQQNMGIKALHPRRKLVILSFHCFWGSSWKHFFPFNMPMGCRVGGYFLVCCTKPSSSTGKREITKLHFKTSETFINTLSNDSNLSLRDKIYYL